ncbi:MAG: transcriptional regulator [Deltaproteobacteria bacterium]|nr:transcriptional regulator [Deltaproteobacteria bacterium]
MIQAKTTRQAIIDELLLGLRTIRDLSQTLRISEKEVISHLPHVKQSAKHKGFDFVIEPSKCLKCGFIFEHREKWAKPSRCPECKAEKITTPMFGLTYR